MAGKRHHFIPQFLQRGFASPDNPENAWVFPRGKSPYNTGIKNIALEGQFYSHEGDTSVDDAITDEEGALAVFVEGLRRAEDGAEVDALQAAKLIAHMLVRTRHVRENFQRLSGSLMDGVYRALSAPEKLVKVFTQHFEDDEDLIRVLRRFLTSTVAEHVSSERLEQLLDEASTPGALREARATLSKLFAENAAESATALKSEGELAQSLLKDAMKSGHLKALRRVGTGSAREEAFAKLRFRVRKYPGGHIILGDSAALYAVEGERRVAPLNDATMPMTGVLLPLDSETCLIGELGEPCDVFATLESVRQAIAGCSLEFFIAAVDIPGNRALAVSVGTSAHLLDSAGVKEVLDGLGLGEGT